MIGMHMIVDDELQMWLSDDGLVVRELVGMVPTATGYGEQAKTTLIPWAKLPRYVNALERLYVDAMRAGKVRVTP